MAPSLPRKRMIALPEKRARKKAPIALEIRAKRLSLHIRAKYEYMLYKNL
jgi:hypothetical protein